MLNTLIDNNFTERAEKLIEINRYREAIPLLTRACSVEPHDYHAVCLLSLCFLELDENEKSLDYAEKAIALAPENEWAYRLKGFVLLKKGKFKDYLVEARQALACEPGNHLAAGNLVNALIQNNQFKEARVIADSLIKLAPEAADTYHLSGWVNLQLGKFAEAERDFQEALKIDPNHAEARHNLAIAVLRKSNNGERQEQKDILEDEALAHFEAAIKQDPNNKLLIDNLKLQFTTSHYYFTLIYLVPLALAGLYITPFVTVFAGFILVLIILNQIVETSRRRKKLSPELKQFLKACSFSVFLREQMMIFIGHNFYRKVWRQSLIAGTIFAIYFLGPYLVLNDYVYFGLKVLFGGNGIWFFYVLLVYTGPQKNETPE